MKLNILGDTHWESKVDQLIDALTELDYRSYFEEFDYGSGLNKIAVFLMCQNPELNLKQRIRLSKKEKTLYMDIMLDLPTMKSVDMSNRKRIVAEKLIQEIPAIVSKYKLPDFDTPRFIADLQAWIHSIEWLDN